MRYRLAGIISAVFVLFSTNVLAVDNMHWTPRMWASGRTAPIADLLEMATVIDNKNRPIYGSYNYTYYNYDYHTENNKNESVSIQSNDNIIGSNRDNGSISQNEPQPTIKNGGRVIWSWEWK